jgi:hypothetical protein
VKKRDCLEDLSIDGEIMIKINFEEMGWKCADRFMWFRIETSVRPV